MQAIKDLTDKIVTGIDSVWEVMLTYVGDVSSFINGVCGLAALLYIGSKVWACYARGESLDIYSLLRPFVIGILCVSFTTVVVPGIRLLCDPVCTYFTTLSEKSSQVVDGTDYVQAAKDARKKGDALLEKLQKKENQDKKWYQPNEGGVLKQIGHFFSHFARNMKGYIFWFFGIILNFLGTLMMCLTKIILVFTRTFSLSVMVLLGPVVFAGSMFPGFKDGLKQWIARFVCIYMWMPLFSLADMFINVINNLIGKSMYESLQAKLATIDSVQTSAEVQEVMFDLWNFNMNMDIVTGLVCLVAAALYKAVPTLASWIIAGGDASGNLSSVSDFAMHAGQVAATLPAAAVGGAIGAKHALGKMGATMAGGTGARVGGAVSGGGGETGAPSSGMGAGPSDVGGTRQVGFRMSGGAPATPSSSPVRMSGGTPPTSSPLSGLQARRAEQHTGEAVLSGGHKFRRGLSRWNNASTMRHGDADARLQVASGSLSSNGILRMAVTDRDRNVQLAAVRNPYASNKTLRKAARRGYDETAAEANRILAQRKASVVPPSSDAAQDSLLRMSGGATGSPQEKEGVSGGKHAGEAVLSGGHKFRRGLSRWNNASTMRHGDADARLQVASGSLSSNGILRMAVTDRDRNVQLAAVRNPYVSNKTLRKAVRRGYEDTANVAAQELTRRGVKFKLR